MKLSVIIVTYLSGDLIAECIDSVFRYNDLNPEELEVIVVENSPLQEAEAMEAYLRKQYADSIRIIINNHNMGYGAGNNIGIANATGDHVLIMNPDVRITEPMFKKALEWFDRKPKLALLGFSQIGNRNISYYLFPELRIPLLQTLIERLSNRVKVFIPSFFYLSGAFMVVDKQKFISAGGFDESIFLYLEEADISRRLRKAGYSLMFDKSISYYHKIDNRIGFSPQAYSVLLQSMQYYCKKYGLNYNRIIRRLVAELRIKRFVAKLFQRNEQLSVVEKNLKVVYETRN